jgi:two-component system sensor histidine kinase RegB
MSPETLNRVAEPFFTTKTAQGGMGLGTFLARAFAERLGGSLTFESELGKGSTALLELPLTCYDEQRETSGADRRR